MKWMSWPAFRAHTKIVVAPAAINRLVTIQSVELVPDERVDLCDTGLVLWQLCAHAHEGLDGVGVRPNVVHCVGRGATQLGKMLKQIFFAVLNSPFHAGTVAACLNKRRGA